MPQKNTPPVLRVSSPMILTLDSSQIRPISAEIPHSLTPRKGPRSSHPRCSTRKGIFRSLTKFTEKDLCQSLFFNKATDLRLELYQACNFIKKEALAQVFSCEFCEISKNTFFTEHLWAAASGGPIILCSFMETFIDVFIYFFPVKKKQET